MFDSSPGRSLTQPHGSVPFSHKHHCYPEKCRIIWCKLRKDQMSIIEEGRSLTTSNFLFQEQKQHSLQTEEEATALGTRNRGQF